MCNAVRPSGMEDAVRVGFACVRVVLPQRRRACNAEGRMRERSEKRGRATSEAEADREVANALTAAGEALRPRTGLRLSEPSKNESPQIGRSLKRAPEAVPALEIEADGCRVERRPVVESHAAAQEERPGATVRARLPARCEFGNDTSSTGGELDQAFEHLVYDPLGVVVDSQRRIEGDRIVVDAEDERAAARRGRMSRRTNGPRDRSSEHGGDEVKRTPAVRLAMHSSADRDPN